jgi:hypothetical protein
MKTANTIKQMARDIRELISACGENEWVEGQNQALYSDHGHDVWYRLKGAKVYRNTVYVQGLNDKWFMLRQYRLATTNPVTPTAPTHMEIMDAMGSMASDAEADAMGKILRERGIEELSEVSDEEFFDLIPLAVERAKGAQR